MTRTTISYAIKQQIDLIKLEPLTSIEGFPALSHLNNLFCDCSASLELEIGAPPHSDMSLEFSLPSEDGIAGKGIQCNEQKLSSSSQEQQIDQIPRCSSTKSQPLHGYCFKCRKKFITRILSSSQSDHKHAAIVKQDLAPRSRVSKGHWNTIVYPFEWVKPGGVEGETTLEDINRQIRMISAAPKPIPHPVKGSVTHTCISARGFGMSGKAVAYVARTRTRGRGSITIIRTKD